MDYNRAELDELKTELKKLGKKIDRVAGESLSAGEVLNRVREQFNGRAHAAAEVTTKTWDEVDGFVAETPWKAAGIGLLAGFAAGWLMNQDD